MCASSSVGVASTSSELWIAEASAGASPQEEVFTAIYNKAVSFGLVSSNKDSPAPLKGALQLCAFRASKNPNLSSFQVQLINEVFKWSLNFTRESSFFECRYVTIGSLQAKLTLSEVQNSLWKLAHHDPIYSMEAFEQASLEIINLRVGNCWEYACLIYVLLMEVKQFSLPMEMIQIEDSWDAVASESINHVFILVGRDPASDLKDPSSWGAGAWIIDPWWEKLGPMTKYQDLMKRHAERMSVLISGEVGHGHTSAWPELFPDGELMDYIPPQRDKEQIPWAFEKNQELIQFAQKAIDESKILRQAARGESALDLNDLAVIKPWLLNQKKMKLSAEMKIEFFSALVPLFSSLPSRMWGGNQFSREDFWDLWNDCDLQNWVVVEEAVPNSDQISLKTAIELFQTAFNTRSIQLCVEFWEKNRPLRIFLESKGFQFSQKMFNARKWWECRQQLLGLVVPV